MPEVRDLPGGVRVTRSKGAPHDPGAWLYQAWEPREGRHQVTHTDEDGTRWGRVDSLAMDPDSVPEGGSWEHMGAVVSWQLERQRLAYQAIREAFPETVEGWRSRGTIFVAGDPAVILERMRRKGQIPADAMQNHAPTFAGS